MKVVIMIQNLHLRLSFYEQKLVYFTICFLLQFIIFYLFKETFYRYSKICIFSKKKSCILPKLPYFLSHLLLAVLHLPFSLFQGSNGGEDEQGKMRKKKSAGRNLPSELRNNKYYKQNYMKFPKFKYGLGLSLFCRCTEPKKQKSPWFSSWSPRSRPPPLHLTFWAREPSVAAKSPSARQPPSGSRIFKSGAFISLFLQMFFPLK